MLFKVLNDDGSCCNGGTGSWHLPVKNPDGTWTPGEWMPAVEGDLSPCSHGYHLCREQDLHRWLGPAIFEAEYRGEVERDATIQGPAAGRHLLQWWQRLVALARQEPRRHMDARRVVEAEDKIVVREARLLRRLETWNECTARLFAVDCAERVVHLCDDPRPRRAIAVARRYAGGEATSEELDAVCDAAWAGAWATARAAARDAAWATARAGAWAAARDAAWAAAWAGAWDAEQEWQSARLMEYLGNGA